MVSSLQEIKRLEEEEAKRSPQLFHYDVEMANSEGLSSENEDLGIRSKKAPRTIIQTRSQKRQQMVQMHFAEPSMFMEQD